jgi:hypothetical protein
MNLRRYILGTVGANLALVGALLWQTARPPAPAPRGRLAVTTHVSTEVVNELAARPAEAKLPGSPPFHWSQIESTNYFVCLTNLLAIGCPKETVRDILEARGADDFRARLRELTRPVQVRFWDRIAEGENLKDLFDEPTLEMAMEELKAERKRVQAELGAVLGQETQLGKPGRNEQIGHLPEATQTALAELESQHTQEREALKRAAGEAQPADRAKREKEVHERHRAERRALFTDAEWAETALRGSAQAQRVRALQGFTGTPEELRSFTQAVREFETVHPIPNPRDPRLIDLDTEYQARQLAHETQLKAFLTSRLGAAGFAAFERGSDPRFHTLLKLARRLDLPPAAAVQWLEIQNAAQAQVRQTRQLAALSDDARALALLALRAETERTLRTAVGPRGWGAYQRSAGDWLKQLSE